MKGTCVGHRTAGCLRSHQLLSHLFYSQESWKCLWQKLWRGNECLPQSITPKQVSLRNIKLQANNMLATARPSIPTVPNRSYTGEEWESSWPTVGTSLDSDPPGLDQSEVTFLPVCMCAEISEANSHSAKKLCSLPKWCTERIVKQPKNRIKRKVFIRLLLFPPSTII